MFEIGFAELLMLGLVALLVVGPEHLPKVARTAGLWVGRARRTFASVRADIERELRAEELKEIMQKQSFSNPLEEIIEEGNAWMTKSSPDLASKDADSKDLTKTPISNDTVPKDSDSKNLASNFASTKQINKTSETKPSPKISPTGET